MDWSWAAASGVQRRGHIVAASRLHLVNNLALDIREASEEHNACLYIHFSTQATLTSDLLDSKSYPHQRASGSTCVTKLVTRFSSFSLTVCKERLRKGGKVYVSVLYIRDFIIINNNSRPIYKQADGAYGYITPTFRECW